MTAYKPVPWEKMYTIGWGHYGVTAGTTWTQSQADSQLEIDLNNEYAPMVDAYVKGKANQNEFDGLVSLAYSCCSVFVADGWAEFSPVSYTHLFRSYFFIFRFEKNMM